MIMKSIKIGTLFLSRCYIAPKGSRPAQERDITPGDPPDNWTQSPWRRHEAQEGHRPHSRRPDAGAIAARRLCPHVCAGRREVPRVVHQWIDYRHRADSGGVVL